MRVTRTLLVAGILLFAMPTASWAADQDQTADPPASAADDVLADGQVGLASEPEDEEAITQGAAFIRTLKQGGWTMFFLAALSVIGVGFCLERLINQRRGRIVPGGLAAKADKLYQAGEMQELQKELGNSTLAKMITAIIEHRDHGPDRATVQAADTASRDLRRHGQRAYPLAVVATLSPLLGLLGTVIGMIGAFEKVEVMGEMANASAFGGDISKALITTGAGLTIAIPALAAYHFFKSRLSLYGVELEEQGGELISRWLEQPQSQAGAPNTSKPQASPAQQQPVGTNA